MRTSSLPRATTIAEPSISPPGASSLPATIPLSKPKIGSSQAPNVARARAVWVSPASWPEPHLVPATSRFWVSTGGWSQANLKPRAGRYWVPRLLWPGANLKFSCCNLVKAGHARRDELLSRLLVHLGAADIARRYLAQELGAVEMLTRGYRAPRHHSGAGNKDGLAEHLLPQFGQGHGLVARWSLAAEHAMLKPAYLVPQMVADLDASEREVQDCHFLSVHGREPLAGDFVHVVARVCDVVHLAVQVAWGHDNISCV